MSNFWHKYTLIAAMLLSSFNLFAQDPTSNNNSPYSRYGVGDLFQQDFAGIQSMGGIGGGFQSPVQLNFKNPASLSSLLFTSFETGVYANFSNLKTDELSINTADGNLSYLALGFPLKNSINKANETRRSPVDWGMAFSLSPYSAVGYDIEITSDSLPNIGEVQYGYKGDGGLYQFTWGNAWKYKGVSVGLNASYLFGKTSHQRDVVFNDIDYAFSDRFKRETNYNGFLWKAGVQYKYVFGDDEVDPTSKQQKRDRMTLVVGAYGNAATPVSTRTRTVNGRINGFYSFGLDTIVSTTDVKDKVNFPSEVGVGFTLAKGQKWLFGGDYSMNGWSGYNSDVASDSLANTFRVAFGGQYLPNSRAIRGYHKRMRYRAGVFYGTDPRVIGGEQRSNYGVTFGLGLPLKIPRGMPSFIDVGFEVGKQTAPNLINETYFKVNLGFILNDNTWFYKQKFK